MTAKFCNIKIVLIAFILLNHSSFADEVFSRTRHKAGLLALIAHNATPQNMRNFSCKNAQITGICRMLVQEGGYNAKRLYGILNITDPEVEHVAMIIDELEGRSRQLPRIGSLILASAISFAYTVPSADGMRAAVHAGRLGGFDENCDGICRAVYSLIIYAVEGKIKSKDELIKVAAMNAESKKVSQAIRGVRLSEWRKLPDESTLLGRLVRVLFLWRRSNGFAEAINMGNRKLIYPESREFLAVLSACWTDLPYLPENFVWRSLMDRGNREICAEMYNMSREAILASVSENMVYGNRINHDYSKTQEFVNGKPIGDSAGAKVVVGDVIAPREPAAPKIPEEIHVQVTHVAPTKNTNVQPESPITSIESIRNNENLPLDPIEPLSRLGCESDSEGERCREVSAVNPTDLFWGSFFAE